MASRPPAAVITRTPALSSRLARILRLTVLSSYERRDVLIASSFASSGGAQVHVGIVRCGSGRHQQQRKKNRLPFPGVLSTRVVAMLRTR
jgi:hypothetical protein